MGGRVARRVDTLRPWSGPCPSWVLGPLPGGTHKQLSLSCAAPVYPWAAYCAARIEANTTSCWGKITESQGLNQKSSAVWCGSARCDLVWSAAVQSSAVQCNPGQAFAFSDCIACCRSPLSPLSDFVAASVCPLQTRPTYPRCLL